MTTEKPDRLELWRQKWGNNVIRFHNPEVHHLLIKHIDKLCQNGQLDRILVPLCGKTLDMKWFADQGISVVGIDGIQTALEQFYTEHKIEWEETSVPALGASGKVLSSKHGSFNLYCTDILDFSKDIAGTFDALWDRGSISAMRREDVPRYVEIMKSLLNPKGNILMEVTEYDVAILADNPGTTRSPPPFPMYEKELKALYEPECAVQFLDREPFKLIDKDIHISMYLISKV